MESERKEKFNPVKIAIGTFAVIVVVVVVMAVVSIIGNGGLVSESSEFAHAYEDGDNSAEKKEVISVLDKMRDLFKKNIRAQVTIMPTTSKTYPYYAVKGNFVSATNRSYGFTIDGIQKDTLKDFSRDVETLINQIERNGFHEYANADNVNMVNFANEGDTVACSIPRVASSDYTISCASVKWFDSSEKSLVEAVASAMSEPASPTLYKVSQDDIEDSPSGGYQRMTMTTVDGFALFYRVNGGSWRYFKTMQGLPVCDDFNTDTLRKAFNGMECRELGNGVTRTVN